ncbi:hypothetical protein EMPS_02494 [Entomortierella parvispora]|uniref:AIG1-type G domain-containing protein n=1 Tax=Entomortierella parvispora TaxID=205924 RepID=A0A9P3H529_9FUNG|nr:hypothetical protein EMPS_02494 [Entomortierella parvispora]
MFGLKFKRKTDSASPSSGLSSSNNSKNEADLSSPSTLAARPSTDLSHVQQDPKQIIPTAFSSSSTDLVSRSNSSGSNNDYSHKNSNSPFHGYHSSSSTAPTSPVQSQYPDKTEIYRVPLEHGFHSNGNNARSNTIKVPAPDDCCTTTTSSAYTTAPSSFSSEIDRRSSQQGPRTNAATKPAIGTFASTTDSPVHPGSSYTLNNNHGMDGTSGSVPASATSSATPSRSSSTSNRGGGGGAGVSTGSFTPLSATPPMTPRLAHEIADSLGANLGDQQQQQQQLFARAFTTQQHTHQFNSQQQSMTGAGSPSSQQAPPSIYGGLLDENDTQATASAGGVGFVSSPISFQPPLNNALSVYGQGQTKSPHATFPQDSFQNVYMPVFPEDNKPTSPTKGQFAHHQQQQGAGFNTRDALMQQQQYQRQQMAQFREDMQGGGCTNSEVPLTSAGAIAAALAQATAPPAPALINSQERTVSMADNTTSNGQHSSATSPTTAGRTPTHRSGGSTMESENQQQQQQQHNQGSMAHPLNPLGGASTFFPAPITRASTTLAASHLITHDVRQSSEHSHIEDGAGPVVLMAIGKTGQGKSSLLNKIMGTSELKASASVRAVTKGIAERTGWGRFEDSRRVLVTLADTPGLADTEGDDEKNIPILKEYIRSVGTRLGVSAFLLVFKIDSGVDMIITILQTFNDIMKDFPNFWDNVILVFTGCDYRRNVMNTKQLYHEEIQAQLQQHFFRPESDPSSTSASTIGAADSPLDPIVPMVFLTCAEAPCGFALGEKCDCKARTTFLNAGIKRLWYAVRNKKRWVLDQDHDDDLQGHT